MMSSISEAIELDTEVNAPEILADNAYELVAANKPSTDALTMFRSAAVA